MAPSVPLPLEVAGPTRTLPQVITKILTGRQTTTTIVTDDGGGTSANSLSGGAIAGIVIGSIVGVLLLIWIIRSCGNMRQPEVWGNTFEPEREKPPAWWSTYRAETPYHRRSHSRHSHRSHHHHHSRSPRRVEVVQPIAYQPRGRSPRAPPAVYYGGRSSHDGRRRSSDVRGHHH